MSEKGTLSNPLKHYSANGAVPRQHGNNGRKPKHAFTVDDVQRVVNLILGYAEEHGLPLPAEVIDRDDEPPILLPCDFGRKLFMGSTSQHAKKIMLGEWNTTHLLTYGIPPVHTSEFVVHD